MFPQVDNYCNSDLSGLVSTCRVLSAAPFHVLCYGHCCTWERPKLSWRLDSLFAVQRMNEFVKPCCRLDLPISFWLPWKRIHLNTKHRIVNNRNHIGGCAISILYNDTYAAAHLRVTYEETYSCDGTYEFAQTWSSARIFPLNSCKSNQYPVVGLHRTSLRISRSGIKFVEDWFNTYLGYLQYVSWCTNVWCIFLHVGVTIGYMLLLPSNRI